MRARLLSLALILASSSAGLAQVFGPAEAVRELEELRRGRIAEAKRAGLPVDAPAIADEVRERAKAIVRDTDPHTVRLEDAVSWGTLYLYAGMYAEGTTAAERLLAHGADAKSRVDALKLLLAANRHLEDATGLGKALVRFVDEADTETLATFMPGHVGLLAQIGEPEETLRLLVELEPRIRNRIEDWRDQFLHREVVYSRVLVLERLGRDAEALELLEAAARESADFARQVAIRRLVGQPAPEVTPGDGFGDFV